MLLRDFCRTSHENLNGLSPERQDYCLVEAVEPKPPTKSYTQGPADQKTTRHDLMTYKELRLDRMKKKEAELLEQAQGENGLGVNSNSNPAGPNVSPDDPTKVTRDADKGQEPVGNLQKNEEPKTLDYWKNRCITAEGRFNKAKPKYDDNMFKMRQEADGLKESIAKLQAKVVKLSTPTNEFEKIDNEHTRNVLGDEVVKSIKETLKETRELANKQAKDFATENAHRDASRSYDTFFDAVKDSIKGDMDKINSDPAFHEFLDGNSTQAGHTYRQLFDAAAKSQDANDVSDFFNTFLEIQTKEPQTVQDSVNNRIGPTGNQGNAQEGKVIVTDSLTIADVNKFKGDMARGAYKGRHSEMVAMQDRIETAYLNGTLQ